MVPDKSYRESLRCYLQMPFCAASFCSRDREDAADHRSDFTLGHGAIAA